MVCPECGSKAIKVLDVNKDYLRKAGADALAWWAEDCFIVRRRGCKDCKASWRSVELPLADLKDALDERASAVRQGVVEAAKDLRKALKALEEVG